jgi:hypothetical protein
MKKVARSNSKRVETVKQKTQDKKGIPKGIPSEDPGQEGHPSGPARGETFSGVILLASPMLLRRGVPIVVEPRINTATVN